ncbi:MAG TPA: PrpF domain-containing protein, partial [Hyphomicrobiaceae bacterium]|nr:PrpF domain-containing protein [Hyphomicrobiaceae bacterium]
ALEAMPEALATLEEIRARASVAMGLAPNLSNAARLKSIPKIAVVTSPRAATTLSGRELGAADMEIAARMISVGQPHRAIPLTGALCLAVATRTPGTIPNRLARGLPPGA